MRPLAIQQKQIIVTCNYEARRRGLYKLQLVTEAQRLCPDVVIVLGEDLTRFRDASKELYAFLRQRVWSDQCERLGFDEIWLDVTDMISHNIELLPRQIEARRQAFFHLDRHDPTQGFSFDATVFAGHLVPPVETSDDQRVADPSQDPLALRLALGSHLAQFWRQQLEQHKGYTATVGISVNKILSKLVGNTHKPNQQSTLRPLYGVPDASTISGSTSAVATFLDPHDIGRIPSIGFKLSQKLRRMVLGRDADFDAGLVYGGTKETVSVGDVRRHPDANPQYLNELLAGPGAPHDIGARVYALLHGIDDTEVGRARDVPAQISIEDSYLRLDTFEQITAELHKLSRNLLQRMRLDLTTPTETSSVEIDASTVRLTWRAIPRTIRLSTRPRPSRNPDGTRSRTFKRISHSTPLPSFAVSSAPLHVLTTRLVVDTLLPMFRRLHPAKAGWDLSLVNVAVTHMQATASDERRSNGRSIEHMFRHQDETLREWRVEDRDMPPSDEEPEAVDSRINDGETSDVSSVDDWEEEPGLVEQDKAAGVPCEECGVLFPAFALVAHRRYHLEPD